MQKTCENDVKLPLWTSCNKLAGFASFFLLDERENGKNLAPDTSSKKVVVVEEEEEEGGDACCQQPK